VATTENRHKKKISLKSTICRNPHFVGNKDEDKTSPLEPFFVEIELLATKSPQLVMTKQSHESH